MAATPFDAPGRPSYLNRAAFGTRVICIATVGTRHSFRELWRRPVIDRLAVENRCHLNGLALRDSAPACAAAVSRTNIAYGWREYRRDAAA